MARVVLIRHGESLWNAQRRLQGHDGVGLSPKGRQQARLTAAWVCAQYPGALLASSDLERAVETAGAIAERLGRASSVERCSRIARSRPGLLVGVRRARSRA